MMNSSEESEHKYKGAISGSVCARVWPWTDEGWWSGSN